MRLYFFGLLIFIFSCNTTPKKSADSLVDSTTVNAEPTSSQTLTIIAVGDMMLGTDFPDAKKLPSKNILATLSPILKDADITVGNLEGVLADTTTRSDKCKDKKNCFAFRMPPHYTDYFKAAGFDFLNIANNHMGDFGKDGIVQTMANLDKAGIKYAGLKNICESVILDKDGIKTGFIGIGHSGRDVHINNKKYIKHLVEKVKKDCDVLIVFFHGGAEGKGADSVTRREEVYFKENRGNMYEMAHSCIDAGADLVFGSGPHLTRAMELYKNRLIAYSLGNFATYGKISVTGDFGIAPLLKIKVGYNGKFISAKNYSYTSNFI